MIGIEGNRKALYQWDLNQRVVLTDIIVGTQIHFFNNKHQNLNDECLVVHAYNENGNIYANIPNILLQKNGSIFVYIYVEHENKAYTEHRAEIIVLARPKPAGYIYTESEVLTYRTLEERIKRIEDNGNAVTVDPTLTQEGQAAEAKITGVKIKELQDSVVNVVRSVGVEFSSINNKINNKQEKGDYALKSDIPTPYVLPPATPRNDWRR